MRRSNTIGRFSDRNYERKLQRLSKLLTMSPKISKSLWMTHQAHPLQLKRGTTMPVKDIKESKPGAKGGPKTAAGKRIASRNALRHGLTAVTHRRFAHPTDIERFAKALCGSDDDPNLFEDALDVAH